MAEYGSGISLSTAFKYDKERIKHALKGELMAGENERGFVYEKASVEECNKYILRAFDNAVYQCLEMAASAKSLEELYEKDTNVKVSIMEYIHAMQKNGMNINNGYEYETDTEMEEN